MRSARRVWLVLKRTGAINIFISFFVFVCAASFVLKAAEPQVHTFFDGLWYCYVASTTIGFGDIYTVTIIGRITTVLVSLYGIFVTAMLTGVVVSYYMEYLKIKERETISMFLEKLEDLPDLSRDELREISKQVKRFNSK